MLLLPAGGDNLEQTGTNATPTGVSTQHKARVRTVNSNTNDEHMDRHRRWLKPKPEKQREPKVNGQLSLQTASSPASARAARVLPMDLKVGDRLVDETGEYEVIGRPYTTNAGKGCSRPRQASR
jgi:hypothetical protein